MRARFVVVIAAGLAATGAATAPPAIAGAEAAASPNPSTTYNDLLGVSAVSGGGAWADGFYKSNTTGAYDTLLLHWNGTAWKKVRSPDPSTIDNGLNGVSAVSGSDAWAAGYNQHQGRDDTLLLHWNGTAWSRVASPSPTASSFLRAVSADSASDAWAVGYDCCSTTGAYDTLILHWNGTAWTQVASPSPSTSYNVLEGVSAVSGSDAWAVGTYRTNDTTGATRTLILHWDGTAWTQVASPSPSTSGNGLNGVSAVSASGAWAAGSYTNNTSGVSDTLLLHWNGTAWKKVASPSPSTSGNELYGVSAVSGSGAWAAGSYTNNTTGVGDTLLLHWNGTAWTRT